MDLFAVIRDFQSVEKVSNLYPQDGEEELSLLFFICPTMKSSGFKLNRNKTGLTTEYTKGENKSTPERVARVDAFADEAKKAGIDFAISAIFSSADALILFPIPLPEPPIPKLSYNVISNYQLVKNNFDNFVELYHSQPWEKVPEKIRRLEGERLKIFFSTSTPSNIIQDFIERVFAGFALDGILMRKGLFGKNPVILGVESPGVAILENAALPQEEWLPIIQLK